MNKSKRGTGRTTRMLEEAITLHNEGRIVYVLAKDLEHVQTIKKQLLSMGADIVVEVLSEIPSFDFEGNYTPLGYPPNCVFLVDHAAIEPIIENLERKLTELKVGVSKYG